MSFPHVYLVVLLFAGSQNELFVCFEPNILFLNGAGMILLEHFTKVTQR